MDDLQRLELALIHLRQFVCELDERLEKVEVHVMNLRCGRCEHEYRLDGKCMYCKEPKQA